MIDDDDNDPEAPENYRALRDELEQFEKFVLQQAVEELRARFLGWLAGAITNMELQGAIEAFLRRWDGVSDDGLITIFGGTSVKPG